MSWKEKEDTFLDVLGKTGLSENEAKIYLELIKHGSSGTTAYDLDHHFPKIKRTTIYSILRKLFSLGHIKEGSSSDTPKKATLFIAIKPENYFKKLISKKREELDFLKDLNDNYAEYFEMMYLSGLEYTLDDIDKSMQPYLKPLLEKGWKISSYYLKEDVPVFGYSIFETMLTPPMYTVYDIMLNPPNFKFLRENSFHLFNFNFDIEQDENAFKFFIESLKKQTKQIISFFSDIKEFTYEEKQITFYDREFMGLNLKINKKDLGKIFDNLKSKIRGYWIDNEELKHLNMDLEIDLSTTNLDEQIEVWKAVIIPFKNKVFFIWSESVEMLNMMVESIFKVENLH
jgi:predicted transcriptional regulator